MKRILLLCAASSALLLVGCSQPSFVINPANQAKCLGQSVVFSVVVSGDSLTSQWQRLINGAWVNLHDGDEGTVSGATTLALTISSVVLADATSYRLVISNSSGSATSDSASLIVGGLPPPAGGVCWWQGEGSAADVFALNPGIVSGSGVTFSPGKEGQAFTFNGAGSVRVPASPNLNVGAGGGFTVEAWVKPQSVAAAQPILEWSAAGITGPAIWIAGDGTLSASIRDEALVDPGFYCYLQLTPGVWHHVALTYDPSQSAAFLYLDDNVAGEAWTSPFVLPVLTIGDFYLGYSPANDLGTGTHFSGQIDEVAIYNRALSLDEVFQLYQTADHRCGIAPALITPLANQTANVGNTVALAVVAAGTSLTYQWLFNSVVIAGATGPVLTLSGVQAEQAGTYSVRVANAWGSVSSSAVLTVNPVADGTPGPTIATQPAGQTTACAGGLFALAVAASGSGSLQYQWCKGGININGATGSSYTWSQASATDAGTYSVIVYDSVGHVTSADAVVTVPQRPTAVVSGDATVASGVPTIIQALLTGTGPWSLQWHRDGEVGPGSYLDESGVADNPHQFTVIPAATTTYKLTSVVDASGCQATAADLPGQATVTVTGAPEQPPANAGVIRLPGGTYNGFTFAGDSTYYVDGKDAQGYDSPVHLYGTTTIEGGTVVRFSSSSYAKIIIHDPTIVCDTGPYRPAIFAWANANDYGYYGGWEVTELTHFGQGLSLALPAGSEVALKNLRFYNLDCGLSIAGAAGGSGTSTYKIYDSQFVDCGAALGLTEPNGCTVKVLNALFCDAASVLAVNSAVQASHIDFQHVTADACGAFISGLSSAPNAVWSGVNSLLVNITSQASIPASLPGPYVQVLQGHPFTTGADGLHYLAGQTYRGIGSLGIDSVLHGELPQKTTHPPLDLPVPLQHGSGYDYYAFQTSGSLTLSPQVPRCLANGSLPDLGYAYDALDYTLSTMWLNEGARVTVLPGTAIGFRFDWFDGFILDQGTSFISQGMPNKPITYAPVSLVQEGPFMPQFFAGIMVPFIPNYSPDPDWNPDGAPPPSLDFRFSNFYLNSGLSHHFWAGVGAREMFDEFWLLADVCPAASPCSAMTLQLRDCNLHSGWFNLGEPDGWVVIPTGYGGPILPGSVVLMNNLVDRVNCNFDPDTGPEWWGGPYTQPTVELSLLATNNLFRGGWLFLEPVPPIPSQTPQWAFVNNLLDTTTIAQDATQPFYYDYNGYYPPGPPYQLLGPGGAHDVVLDQAPPYQPGPLGNFYLPNTVPGTAQLFNKGSCPPGDIGLFHYTTRADQAKEGEESSGHQVNIGLHYIAVETTGAKAGQPKDYDHDLIPDCVENWHGDGRTDWQDETDWQTPSDPTSTVYDDVDLSGSGLVGRVKKTLGITSFDTSNPLALRQVSTGAEPDAVSFVVGINYTDLSGLGSLQLDVDGEPVQVYMVTASAATGSLGKCLITWNTTFTRPGCHLLSATLNVTGRDSQPGSVHSASGAAVLYPINSVLFFDPACANSYYDDTLLSATLTVLSADYVIALYDPATYPSGSPIKTITGSTSTGSIEANWDVKYQNGSPYTGDSAMAVFTVTPTGGSAESHARPLIQRPGPNDVPEGMFDMAYYPPHAEDAYGNANTAVQVDVVNPLLDPASWEPDALPGTPYQSSFNRSMSFGSGGYAGFLQNQAQADLLIANLCVEIPPQTCGQDTRNFYFIGHGDENNIGDFSPNFSVVKITRDSIGQGLKNKMEMKKGIPNYAFHHRFRLVWLDACNTAKDPNWAAAFGVVKRITWDGIRNHSVPPQAFLGWIGDFGGPKDSAGWLKYADTLGYIWSGWMRDTSLFFLMDTASQEYPLGRDGPHLTLPMRGYPDAAGHWDGHPMIYGYRFLTRSSCVPPASYASPFNEDWYPQN